MTIRAIHRWVLWAGLGGSFALVLIGTWLLVSGVWAESFAQTLEVLVAAPFLALWALSPMLWAAWPRSEPPPSQGDAVISFCAAALLVGLSAYAYVPEFVVLPLFFHVQPGLDSLRLVLLVPALQWSILGAAGATRWVRRR